MKKYIDECLEAFSNGYRVRVEIETTGDPLKFRNNFYAAMRRRGLYWRLALDGNILHVMKAK